MEEKDVCSALFLGFCNQIQGVRFKLNAWHWLLLLSLLSYSNQVTLGGVILATKKSIFLMTLSWGSAVYVSYHNLHNRLGCLLFSVPFSHRPGIVKVYIFNANHKRKLHFPRSRREGLRHPMSSLKLNVSLVSLICLNCDLCNE